MNVAYLSIIFGIIYLSLGIYFLIAAFINMPPKAEKILGRLKIKSKFLRISISLILIILASFKIFGAVLKLNHLDQANQQSSVINMIEEEENGWYGFSNKTDECISISGMTGKIGIKTPQEIAKALDCKIKINDGLDIKYLVSEVICPDAEYIFIKGKTNCSEVSEQLKLDKNNL